MLLNKRNTKATVLLFLSAAHCDAHYDVYHIMYSACRLVMPIPYKLPPDPYLHTDKPWCVDENYSGVDSLGRNIDDPVESFYGHVQSPD